MVEVFAFVHDSCRVNDWEDPDHGPRAAEYAERLKIEMLFELSDRQDEVGGIAVTEKY